jgi:hypothetical protein
MALRLQKPRNPLVAPTLMRQAGRHGGFNPGAQQRQAGRRELHQQILQLGKPDRIP